MEGTQLLAVRKFVKQTLNLSDAAKITDFALQMTEGKLKVEARISMEINYEELSSLSEIPTNGKTKRTYTPSMKESAPRSKMPMKSGSYSSSRTFEATASDFHCIRVILRGWRKSNQLNENEMDIVTGYAGKFFVSMSQEEKSNFLSFFYAVRTRLDQKKSLTSK